MPKKKKKLSKLEARRLRIVKVIMTRYFKDGLWDVGQLILEVEKLIESELAENDFAK